MLYVEFLLLLAFLYAGSRFGGIGLGVVSGIGLFVEVFILGMPLSKAPIDVMLVILAVVACASVLEAAGGLKFMLQIAERILRSNPKMITILGPIVTYVLTLMLGTGHSVYSIMPIIGDIALKNQIRPERPMAAASVASQLGITGSPLSAAVAYYLTEIVKLQGFEGVTLLNIISVTMPATFCGVLAMSLYSLRRGKELKDDQEYQARLQDPEFRKRIEETSHTSLNEVLPQSAKNAVYLFLCAIAAIVVIAMFPQIKPLMADTGKAAGMDKIIQIVMLCFAGLILVLTKTDPKNVPNGIVFKSGIVATIAIFGIAWMSDTYFTHAMPQFKAGVTEMVRSYPWTFAFALFAVSVVVNSQAVTAKMLLPVGIGLGLPAELLVGLMPATYAYFFIPNYPSDIATVNFDITGTTKIGKYYFNHSFMAVGLVGVIVACLVGISLAEIFI